MKKPGEVLEVDKHGIILAAARGALRITELQIEGADALTRRPFSAGISWLLATG